MKTLIRLALWFMVVLVAAPATAEPPAAADKARVTPVAKCQERLRGLRVRPSDDDFAFGFYEAAQIGPCLDARLKKLLFDRKNRLHDHVLDYAYDYFYNLANDIGAELAADEKRFRCRPSELPWWGGWYPAALDPLDGACAIPEAWKARGLTKRELCLDARVFSLVLEMWTRSGGDPAVEDAFVRFVRHLSAQAPLRWQALGLWELPSAPCPAP
jgi:hypothetical protein